MRSSEKKIDGVACLRRNLLGRVSHNRMAAAWARPDAALVPSRRAPHPAADRRRRDRAAAPCLDRVSLAVLGNDCPRPDDVGYWFNRVDSRRVTAWPRDIVGWMVHGVRAVWCGRSAPW